MNDVKRKPNESFDALLRRFQRRVQTSGLVKEVRRRKNRPDEKNETARRASKVRGIKMTSKMQWMLKVGKATEADFMKKKRSR